MKISFRREKFIDRMLLGVVTLFAYIFGFFFLSSCSGEKPFDAGATTTTTTIAATTTTTTTTSTTTTTTTLPSYSGYLVVSSVTTDPATGPGFLTMFKPDGTFHKVLRDFFAAGTEWASSTTFVAPDQIVTIVESSTSDRMEVFTIDDPTTITNQGVGFVGGAPLRGIAQTTNGDFYVVENNGATSTIEKFNSSFNRSGGPYIGTGTTCSLNAVVPYGITYIASTDRIGVTATGGRFNLYDNATGNCVSSTTTGTFAVGNAPSGIAYHPTYNRLLVVLASGNAIHSCAVDGTGCVAVYSSAGVLNTPRSIAIDSSGNIFVSSSGNDNIIKFSWTGSGNLTLVSSPFIPVGAYTQNVQSIMVIP